MSEPNYEEIRKRITKRYENRAEFFGNLVAFIIINGLLWSGALGIRQGWLLTAFTGLWFLGVVIHFINFLWSEARERAIEQAIDRERSWTGAAPAGEKPKRDRRTRLTDDGELWEVVEDEEELRQNHRS